MCVGVTTYIILSSFSVILHMTPSWGKEYYYCNTLLSYCLPLLLVWSFFYSLWGRSGCFVFLLSLMSSSSFCFLSLCSQRHQMVNSGQLWRQSGRESSDVAVVKVLPAKTNKEKRARQFRKDDWTRMAFSQSSRFWIFHLKDLDATKKGTEANGSWFWLDLIDAWPRDEQENKEKCTFTLSPVNLSKTRSGRGSWRHNSKLRKHNRQPTEGWWGKWEQVCREVGGGSGDGGLLQCRREWQDL